MMSAHVMEGWNAADQDRPLNHDEPCPWQDHHGHKVEVGKGRLYHDH